MKLNDNLQKFSLITVSINSSNQIAEFKEALNKELDDLIQKFYMPSEVNQHAVLLESNGHPGFKSYQRGSFFVDCIASCDTEEQAEQRIVALKKSNIPSFRMFHEGNSAVCIPAINDNGKFSIKN
ncbi:MAG: hypothetical protein Q8M40_11635 [Legionella sp.]|nr:hypothetical protein [Legionella sp.]